MTLVVYDNTGCIFSTITGSYVVPQGGVQYVEVEIPEGKRIVSMNTTTEQHTPVFEDLPVPETRVLEDRITYLESAFNEMVLGV